MEILRHGFDPLQSNIARQAAVGAQHPGPLAALRHALEMRDLLQRVYTGIGTPGTNQIDLLVGDEPDRGFEVLLHRFAVRLTLPAAIGRAAVFDADGILHESTPGVPGIAAGSFAPETAPRPGNGWKLTLIMAMASARISINLVGGGV